MKKKTPKHRPPLNQVPGTIDEMARRFVRDDKVLACDRHAHSVRAFAASLTSDTECEDQILLDLDAALKCSDCSSIREPFIGYPTWQPEEVERVIAHCQAAVHASEENAGRETASFADVGGSSPFISNVLFYIPKQRILTVNPICLPSGPYCPTPVRLAAARKHGRGWAGIRFGHEESIPIGFEYLPEPLIRDSQYPLVVTTPYRAQLEYAKGNDWHVSLPLAPQRTVIVLHRNSRLYDAEHQVSFENLALVSRLGGCALAVADKTSSYASRLILAARHAGVKELFVSGEPPRERSDEYLYLVVEPDYDKMVDLLEEEKIDGFSTVEPAPTLAKVRLGNWCVEGTVQDTCTSATSGVCCVVMTPSKLVQNHEAYEALLRALICSICSLMKKGGLQRLIKLFEKTINKLPAEKYSFDSRAIATQAAVSALGHFTAHLRPHLDQPEECANFLLPDITIEAIRAEATALSPYLKGDERKQWLRGLERLDDPKSNLFNFERAREIFRELLPADFKGRVQGLDAEIKAKS